MTIAKRIAMRVPSSIAAIAATAVIGLSCSGGLEPPDRVGDPPADSTAVVPPRLDVSVTVARPPVTGGGFVVVVSMTGLPHRVSPLGARGGEAHFADLPPGTHAVELRSWSAACTVAGENPRSFAATPGEITTVSFAVTCTAPVDSLPSDSVPRDSMPPDSVQIDSFLVGSWTARSPMPGPRWQPAAATLDGIVYVAGGAVDHSIDWEPDVEYLGDIVAYDPARDTWRVVGQLLDSLRAPAMVALNGHLYVIGGCRDNPFHPITTVQVFDPATGQVEGGPALPYGICEAAAVVLEGRIHVVGGWYLWDPSDPYFGDAATSAHWVFDPATNAWSELAPLPVARAGHGAAVLDGRIYVQGGQGNVTSSPKDALQMYDPATDSWTVHASPSDRFSVGSATVEAKLYVFGGWEYVAGCCGTAYPSPAVERFDPASGSWAAFTPLPQARIGMAAAAVGQFVYVIGGSWLGNGAGALATVERFTPDNP